MKAVFLKIVNSFGIPVLRLENLCRAEKIPMPKLQLDRNKKSAVCKMVDMYRADTDSKLYGSRQVFRTEYKESE